MWQAIGAQHPRDAEGHAAAARVQRFHHVGNGAQVPHVAFHALPSSIRYNGILLKLCFL